jgi:hypothetical protein
MSAVGDFIFGKMLQKGVVSLVKLVVSWLFAGGIVKILESYGVKIDEAAFTLAATGAINSLLTMLRNWLKVTNPKLFGWL